MRYKYFILFGLLCMITSCVSIGKYRNLESEYDRLRNNFADLNVKSTEQSALISRLGNQIADSEYEIENLESIRRQYEDLSKLSSSDRQEMNNLLKRIQQYEESLQKKEDELKERNKKLIELQNALASKDNAVNELRRKITDALVGFEGKGLTVMQKNGKVYVSVEDKLLFKSGSYEIETPGMQALNRIGKVLEQNPEINILVEGHTDNVKYSRPGALIDNWDLSVKRATSVVRALLAGSKINPERITAAGRSEYMPLGANDTNEGRQKNRRTEIILTPKLNEILDMLEIN